MQRVQNKLLLSGERALKRRWRTLILIMLLGLMFFVTVGSSGDDDVVVKMLFWGISLAGLTYFVAKFTNVK